MVLPGTLTRVTTIWLLFVKVTRMLRRWLMACSRAVRSVATTRLMPLSARAVCSARGIIMTAMAAMTAMMPTTTISSTMLKPEAACSGTRGGWASGGAWDFWEATRGRGTNRKLRQLRWPLKGNQAASVGQLVQLVDNQPAVPVMRA